MTITDDDAIDAMRSLASGSDRDAPLVVGESGGAGFAGLAALARDPDPEHFRAVGLNATSHVLVTSTEGATAPDAYEELVGETADSVLARQQAWAQRIAV